MCALRTVLSLSLVAVMVLAATGHGADTRRRPRRPRRPEPAPVTGDVYPLVFLGPQGAVFFNLVVDTGKRTIADTRRDYAAVVFRTHSTRTPASLWNRQRPP